MEQRRDAGPLADVQRPDALRPVELVPAQGEQVHAEVVDVERELADGLHGIGVEENARFSRRSRPISASGSMVPTSLFACMMETRIGVGSDGLPHFVRVDEAAAVDGHAGDLVAALLEVLAGLEHGVVLDGGGDEVPALLALRIGRTEDGPVVRLGPAAGEVDLLGLGAQAGGDGLASFLHRLSGAES